MLEKRIDDWLLLWSKGRDRMGTKGNVHLLVSMARPSAH